MEVKHEMIYDPKTEAEVLLTLQELGEGTSDEVKQFYDTHYTVIDGKLLTRYLRRWKAKKVIAAVYHDGQIVWKLADIPPYYMSGIMAICKTTNSQEMKDALDALEERRKGEQRIVQPKSVWGGYVHMDVTFETVDPILGGWQTETDGETKIPSYDHKRFIPANWFKGWLRSNAGLIDLPQAVCYRIGILNADLPNVDPLYFRLKVKMGMNKYEAIPPKTQFTTSFSFPLRGSKLKTPDDWIAFLRMIGEHPLRGLGANPYALGGRVKLIDAKPRT